MNDKTLAGTSNQLDYLAHTVETLSVENERLTRERDQATAVVGELAALIPLSETIQATRTGATLVQWFKDHLRASDETSARPTDFLRLWQLLCDDINAEPCRWPGLRNEMHDWLRARHALKAIASLRTPQGEPALTSPRGLPGTREPVVTEPKGNAGESPALIYPDMWPCKYPRMAGSIAQDCEYPNCDCGPPENGSEGAK